MQLLLYFWCGAAMRSGRFSTFPGPFCSVRFCAANSRSLESYFYQIWWEDKPISGAIDTLFTFQICCYGSKLGRVRSKTEVKFRIFGHLYGRDMREMSELFLRVQHTTKPPIYFDVAPLAFMGDQTERECLFQSHSLPFPVVNFRSQV